jgi:hypothetical protein
MSQVYCSVPVVFLIFRRPDLTAQVFERIRTAKPSRLLVVADGPRNEEEAELCYEARKITEEVDWNCEVLRNYSDINLGCRNRVSSGLTWAFEQVEEAIILEDDCLPHPSFFSFCSQLLDLYRNDNRVFSICGSNFQEGIKRGDGDFYFSRHADPWGWATWRRSWQFYDNEMKLWPLFKKNQRIQDIFSNVVQQKYWTTIFDGLYYLNTPDSWFYRWQLSGWINNSLSIWPNFSLISNIGYGDDSTHYKSRGRFSDLSLYKGILDTLDHPSFMIADYAADYYLFLFRYSGFSFVEEEKYGFFYKWILRYREFKKSPTKYVCSTLKKLSR